MKMVKIGGKRDLIFNLLDDEEDDGCVMINGGLGIVWKFEEEYDGFIKENKVTQGWWSLLNWFEGEFLWDF